MDKENLAEETEKRLALINEEFRKGFEFIKNEPKSVTIFGSTRFGAENLHYKSAERLSGRLSKLGYTVITGGGPGIMEAANKGAMEAGGTSLGLTISLPNEQSRNKYLTRHCDFYYFFIRKVLLSFSAEAYVFFPGGFGTLDEFFETITLIQTKKITRVPIILVGRDFWGKMDWFLRQEVFIKHRAIDETDTDLYLITDDEDEVVEVIKKVSVQNGVRIPNGYPK